MHEEKIKVESLDIIVTITDGKPYYSIKYKEVGNRHYNVGYSSLNLDFVLEWRKQYFEAAEAVDAKETNVPSEWVPCSERLPEHYVTVLAQHGKRFSDEQFIRPLVLTDEEEWYGDLGLLNGEVIAWMPLPKPYKEKTE